MSGIMPAPYFFEVREESGEVVLKADLRNDRQFQYIVSKLWHNLSREERGILERNFFLFF